MEGYSQFPKAILLCRASFIRVTHPSAAISSQVTRPLDLHVLGLPLAFILSQNQTLHSEFSSEHKKIVFYLFVFPTNVGRRFLRSVYPDKNQEYCFALYK